MVLRSHLTITEFLLLGLCADPKVLVLFWELFLGICLATMIGSLMAWWCPGRIPASSHLGTFSWVTSPPWIFASLQSQCPSFRKTSSKGKSLQKRDAWLKPSLCLTSEGQTSSCSLPWLMTPVLPSASLCSMARWWAASCMWIRCGLHGAWVFCTQLLTSPPLWTWTSVRPIPPLTTAASCCPSSLCPALISPPTSLRWLAPHAAWLWYILPDLLQAHRVHHSEHQLHDGQKQAFSPAPPTSLQWASPVDLMPTSVHLWSSPSPYNTVVTPLVNALNFSLKNQEVKAVLRITLGKCLQRHRELAAEMRSWERTAGSRYPVSWH